jgi:predicted  nucleic acid-binding Zn-ribbon protein
MKMNKQEQQLVEIEEKVKAMKVRLGELKDTYGKAVVLLKADLDKAKKLLAEAEPFLPVLLKNEVNEFLKGGKN